MANIILHSTPDFKSVSAHFKKSFPRWTLCEHLLLVMKRSWNPCIRITRQTLLLIIVAAVVTLAFCIRFSGFVNFGSIDEVHASTVGSVHPSLSSSSDTANIRLHPSHITLNGFEYEHQQLGDTSCYSLVANDLFCLPSLIVAGFEKCGSSALYFKLQRHPAILGHPRVKEWCPSDYEKTTSIIEWARSENMPRMSSNSSQKFLINGCLTYAKHPKFFRKVADLSKRLKVLVMVRNYADWAYSYYSYRCVEGYDVGCESLRSVASIGPWKKTRNPADFHDLVVDAEKGRQARHHYFNRIRPDIWLYREFLRSIITTVGRENVLILRQEDLTLTPQKVLGTVAGFIGVDEDAFPGSVYSLVSNTNSKPALKQDMPANATATEVIGAVNSGHLMMTETRQILNTFWAKECEWLRSMYSIDYPDSC